jgi:hypothetical protein
MARSGIVGMNVSPAAREQLKRLALNMTGPQTGRVTLDGAVIAACAVASAHLDETVAAVIAAQADGAQR